MAENKTEALKKQLEEEKAEREAQRLLEEKNSAEEEKPGKKIMPSGLPYLIGALVAFIIAILTKGIIGKIVALIIGVLVILCLDRIRAKSIREANIPGEKEFSSEIAGKLHELQDLLIDRAKGIKKPEVKESLGSIAGTLNKIADEVENDPKDRNKVRKLAWASTAWN